MKKGKIALLLLIISIFWTVWSVYTYADENRSIYVGFNTIEDSIPGFIGR